jgi:hypothetical protein
MKICPKCNAEVPELDWNCPHCGYHFPPEHKGTGHATSGVFKDSSEFEVSNEDVNMIRDKNHLTPTSDEFDGIEADAPYTVKHDNEEEEKKR